MMDAEVYKTITQYIYKSCGIELGENKEYLLNQRLEPLMKAAGCNDFKCFADILNKRGYDSSLREKIVAAITTNETFFFRDGTPFDDFKQHVMPELINKAIERKSRSNLRKGSKISIWSGASSTGQEAYSLAMLIHECLSIPKEGVFPRDFVITGTDISTSVLAQAMNGEYREHEIKRGLSTQRLDNHFEKIGTNWMVKPHLKELVSFRQLNLTGSFTFLGGFDVIFMRNVLIYFDETMKKQIIDQIHYLLPKGGYLVLGSAENLYTLTDKFESVKIGKTLMYRAL